MCTCERERENVHECVRECIVNEEERRKDVFECVYVKERERERESVCVCVCVCVAIEDIGVIYRLFHR